jgi:arsenate reductase
MNEETLAPDNNTNITIYGIPNCDTVQKTIAWFKANNITFEFYDYKKNGITAAKLKPWCKQKGWEVLLNKKSTSWRDLGKEAQANITDAKTAITVMVKTPSIIKRPVVEQAGKIVAVGFDKAVYEKLFLV